MTEPKGNGPTKITVSLPPELVKALDEHAEAEQRSRSNLVALLLRRALDSRQAG